MNELVETAKNRLRREIEKKGKVLDITQEDNILYGWYNDDNNSTHVVESIIPFYDAYNNLKQANNILGA